MKVKYRGIDVNNCRCDGKKLSIQHIVASVDKDGYKLARDMRLKCGAVIANQNKKYESIVTKKTDYGELKIVNTKTVGVGKNRNIGLVLANSDICVLSDDDMEYTDSYIRMIQKAFNERKRADVIIFDIEKRNINKNREHVRMEGDKRVTRLNFAKYGGSRIVFRRDSIRNKNIWFTELFGGGAKYSCGEDTLFLRDCLKNGLRIYTSSSVIAYINHNESTWFKGYNEKFFYDEGALLYNLFPFLCRALVFVYAGKFKSDIPYMRRVKMVRAGICGYKKGKSFDDFQMLDSEDNK